MSDSKGRAVGFTFRETMQGFVGPGDGFAAGQKAGKATGEHLRFRVTVAVDDLKAFLGDKEHSAEMSGTVDSGSLGIGMPIDGGTFKLFARDERGHRTMQYRLPFTSAAGETCLLEGYKDVHNDRTFDFWYDTTALFTTLHRPGGTNGEASQLIGILRIRPIDLIPQVWSMRALHTRNPARHVLALGRFGWFFASNILDEYRPGLGRKRKNGMSA
ncbi:MAG: hypothetical protein R3C29_14335 [Dehalococcoidia bacterium]